jgi:SSS family solute:Na+ symporter
LAGAKLASATFIDLDLNTALLIMGGIAVIYTVIGGLKAVIYTDTIQWAILLLSLIFIGIPVSYIKLGGWEAISSSLGPEFFSLTNVTWQDLVKWAVTIIPIWFVGMTLYQRIYAAKDIKTAKRAWYLAGLFEYPVMAFMGVTLGLLARVAADQGLFAIAGFDSAAGMDHEMGLPLLLRHILPVGLMGIMMAAYFSAIMSTADSCLMAASGNLLTDIINFKGNQKKVLLVSQAVTLLIGGLALLLALNMHDVLTLMFYSYGFMVSGLFIPIIGGLFFKRRSSLAAIMAMLVGGSVTTVLQYFNIPTWQSLDPNVFGIAASLVIFLFLNRAFGTKVSALNT